LPERWRRYLRFWGPDVDGDIADELRYHLDMRTQFYRESGMSDADARRAALESFGDLDGVTRELRNHDRGNLRRQKRVDMLQDIVHDIRYGLRQLAAAPRFTVAVIAVLALGIGANTAIFSVIDAALIRPLPFAAPDRLVSVSNVEVPFELSASHPKSAPVLADFRADSTAFSSVAAYARGSLNLAGGTEPVRTQIAYVTDDFFRTLGRTIAIGREPVAAEFTRGGPKVVVLAHSLWQQQFGGARSVIGHEITLNAVRYTVVGVMPLDFHFPSGVEIWIPLALPFGSDIMEAFRNYLPSEGIARLAPTVTVAQAAQHADALRRRFRAVTKDDSPVPDLVRPLQTTLLGDRRAAMDILAASAFLLLLIACANVTNLLLSRAATRRREIAVRVVLGATRGRVIRQLFVEGFLLALGGGIIAVLVAAVSLRLLVAMLPQTLAAIAPPTIDGRVLAFTLATALATSLVFGVWPALGLSRVDLGSAMKLAGAGGGGSRRRSAAHGVLVIAEVALALMLLIGAGLMTESMRNLLREHSGVQTENVVTGRLTFPGRKYGSSTAESELLNRVLARLRGPGIDAAAVSALPMEGVGGIGLRVAPADHYDEAHAALGLFLIATPGYFSVMGARLRGSDLPPMADTAHKVAVINETLAKQLWPGQEAIGKQMAFGPERRTVIGVVGDIRTRRLDDPAVGQMYLPMAEQAQSYASIVVRGSADERALMSRLRDAVRGEDPNLPVYQMRRMDEVIAASVAPRRTNTILLVLFGGLAVVLATVGVYAVLSYGVAQRTREIGVRVALGAQRSDVVGMIVGDGARLTAVGVLIGVLGAYFLSRFVSSLLYGVSPQDPRVFVAAALGLATVACAAAWIPAWRATRVDPITALREE
jgi:putative ABC transport system permease protein